MSKHIVLIVGTDFETRLLYRLFLERWGFGVIEAECFEEITTILDYFSPELILMDGNLSFEDNLETVRKIRSLISLRNTPLILASGHSQSQIRDAALNNGVDSFLVKPLDFADLQNGLCSQIQKYCQGNYQGEIG